MIKDCSLKTVSYIMYLDCNVKTLSDNNVYGLQYKTRIDCNVCILKFIYNLIFFKLEAGLKKKLNGKIWAGLSLQDTGQLTGNNKQEFTHL